MPRAFYDVREKVFFKDDRKYSWEDLKRFETFKDLQEELDGDYTDCNFSGFDFEGIEITPEMVEKCVIDSDVLISRGLYDDTFYQNNFNFNYDDERSLVVSEKTPTKRKIGGDYYNVPVIGYISDLHLDHKVYEKFPDRATKREVEGYIEEIVDSLINEEYGGGCICLIGGDVAHNYVFSEIFYHIIGKKRHGVMAVLGNHEYWGDNITVPDGQDRYETIKETYRQLFEKNGITFLDNSIFCTNDHLFHPDYLTEDDLNRLSAEELKEKLREMNVIIFGGTGFTGLNKKYNADMGLYRGTIDREHEIKLSSDLDRLYRKLVDIPEMEIVCLTHMPKEDWSDARYNDSWWYVDGHTHNNRNRHYGSRKTHSDNQIGYVGKILHLKYFALTSPVNIYRYLPDGIYHITDRDYSRFYTFLDLSITYSLSTELVMLKNSGFYAFLYKSDNGYHLLDGGKKRSSLSYDIEWIYNRVPVQATDAVTRLGPFMKYITDVSDKVKAFGGLGHIHGSIVDIDGFNHIYVNPLDGKLTPYYATDIVNKVVFPDVKTLLKESCPYLLDRYEEAEKKNDRFLPATVYSTNDIEEYKETDIYRPSLYIKKLQYIFDYSIVRSWNNDLDYVYVEESKNIPTFNWLPEKTGSFIDMMDASKKIMFMMSVFQAMEVIDWCRSARDITRTLGERKSQYYRFKDDDVEFMTNKLRKFFKNRHPGVDNKDFAREAVKFALEHYEDVSINERAEYLKNLAPVSEEDIESFNGETWCSFYPPLMYENILNLSDQLQIPVTPLYNEVIRVSHLGARKKPHSQIDVENFRAKSEHREIPSFIQERLERKKIDIFTYDPVPHLDHKDTGGDYYEFWKIFDMTMKSLLYLEKVTNGKFGGDNNTSVIKSYYPILYFGTGDELDKDSVKKYVLIKHRDEYPSGYCSSLQELTIIVGRIVDLIYGGKYLINDS